MADSSRVDSNVITTATDASGATVISVVQSNVIESSRVDSVITTGGKGNDGEDGEDGVGVPVGGSTGQVLAKNSATDYDTAWVDQTGGGGGVTDHGALTGLSDDDHTQYHNDTRGDVRYNTKAEITTALSGKANTSHTHAQSDVTNLVSDLSGKQATLVSGTNIKTINGTTLLGSGDLVVSGGSSTLVFNVKDYGALGDGVADDTAEIQATIDAANTAGGGDVFIPRGLYLISSRINLKKRVNIRGAGMSNDGITPLANTSGTLIRQTSNSADGFYLETNGSDTGYITIENLSIEGNGIGVSTANGINLERNSSNPILHIYISAVTVRGFGNYGIQAEALINSVIEKCLVSYNGGGINVFGEAGFPATSTVVRNNYLNWNTGIGIRFNYTDYSSIRENASDHQDIHYQIGDCTNVTVEANGAEWNNTDTPTNGIGFDVWGSRFTSLDNNFVYQNKNIALRVRSSATYASTNTLVRNFRNAVPDGSTTGMDVASGNFVAIDGLDVGAGGIGTITGSGVVYDISSLYANLRYNSTTNALESTKHLNPAYDFSFNLGSGATRYNAAHIGTLTLYYGTGITMAGGSNIVLDSGTGTKIGTATTEKIGFWNATPITRPSGNLLTAIANTGLVSSPTIDGADITTGTVGTARLGSGTASSSTYLRGDGTWATVSGGGGSGTPGGSDTQIQFNDGGAFGGDAGLTYNKTTDTLGTGVLAGNSSGSLILAGGTSGGSGAGIELFNYNTGVLRAGSGYAFQWSGSRFAGGYSLGMDLGDTSNYFNNLYAQKHYFNSTASFDGATAGIIKTEADVEITDTTKGVILKSPDGTRWRMTVGNDGAITTTVA